MKIGYYVTTFPTEESKNSPATALYREHLIKHGAEEVVIDTNKHELLSDLLDRLKPGDSLYLSDILHLSYNRQTMKEILQRMQDKDIALFVNDTYILYTDPRMQKEIDHVFDIRDERLKSVKSGLNYVSKLRQARKASNPFKSLRQESGMTQKAYAEYFDIPQRTIENWESGQRVCPKYLFKLMEYKLKNEGICK